MHRCSAAAHQKTAGKRINTMSFQSGRFDMHARFNAYRTIPALVFACLFVIAATRGNHGLTPKVSATPVPDAPLLQSEPQAVSFNACTIFSAADAAQVLGVPVRPVTMVGNCSYEAAKATSGGGWHRNTALNVFKYKSAAEESSAWGDLKILRRLEPGRKNVTVLSGIGSEAYMQILPNGDAFEAELWVHKSTWHLRLVSVTEQSPSPDVLKATAQKIVAKLP
jgi:hypothetical protein